MAMIENTSSSCMYPPACIGAEVFSVLYTILEMYEHTRTYMVLLFAAVFHCYYIHTHTPSLPHLSHLDQNSEDCIDMPTFTWTVFFSCYKCISGNVRLELGLCHIKKAEDFLHDGADIVLIDESKREFEGSTSNRDVVLLQTLQDGIAVTLHCIIVNYHSS